MYYIVQIWTHISPYTHAYVLIYYVHGICIYEYRCRCIYYIHYIILTKHICNMNIHRTHYTHRYSYIYAHYTIHT